MKYLEQVWFLLFSPGKRDCVVGYSHDIIREDDEDEDIESGGSADTENKADKEPGEGNGDETKVKEDGDVEDFKEDEEKEDDEEGEDEDYSEPEDPWAL